MTPNTIDTLRTLGYELGIAQGSVAVEEDALAAAQAQAEPGAVIENAGTIAKDTLADLANAGNLPTDRAQRLELANKITLAALDMVQTHANEKVEFHTRAVAEAKAMPDVWRVNHTVDADGTELVALSTLVACKADGTGWDDTAQAQLDALANPDAFAEREYQALNPDAMQAMQLLSSRGRVCARPKPGADTFDVDGVSYSGADLLALAEKVAAEPPAPTPAEAIAALDPKTATIADVIAAAKTAAS